MRRRLSALLLAAVLSGTIAGTVSANQRPVSVPPARIAAPPRMTAIAEACPLPAAYRAAFAAAARRTNLPLALLVAVAQVESNLNPDARSYADARGLMQVLPTTAQELGLDPDERVSNVLAGARYLELLFDRFRSSDLTLAAYNAGPTAVERAGGAPTLATLTYVTNVTSTWRELRGCR
jgi:soluble lytic murein transglycosylase-like protein